MVGGGAVRRLGLLVLDQVGDHALRRPPPGVSSETGSSTRSKSSRTRCSGKPESFAISSIEGSRFSFCASWRRERWARRTCSATCTGQADRAALVGERAGDRLADPPGRVRRELVPHPVVELLDRADQAEVALLDQVQQRHAGLRVVARDRHDEPQVALDQAALGARVAEILEARELPLLGRREQPPVADLADVELERVGGLEALVLGEERVVRLLLDLFFDLVQRRQQPEDRLGRLCFRRRLGKRLFHLCPYRRQERKP